MILDNKKTLPAETNKVDLKHSERAGTPSFSIAIIPNNACHCYKAGVFNDK